MLALLEPALTVAPPTPVPPPVTLPLIEYVEGGGTAVQQHWARIWDGYVAFAYTFAVIIQQVILVLQKPTELEVRARYISHKNPPAATMIGVDQLVEPELLLEIEAVAAVD